MNIIDKSKKLIVLFLFTLLSALTGCGDELPSRSDCIVNVKINWNIEEQRWHKNELVSAMLDKFIQNYRKKFKSIPPPGYSIQGKDSEDIYIQYKDSCQERFIMTNEFVESNLLEGAGSIVISESVITPNHDTIREVGPYWRD